MKPVGVNICAQMKEIRENTLEDVGPNLGKAQQAYDNTLAEARRKAGITSDPTCVACPQCGAKKDHRCVTNAKKAKKHQKPTTPHSARSYAYHDLVRSVHGNPLVQAAKRRYDDLALLKAGARYESGHSTCSVRVAKNAMLVCMLHADAVRNSLGSPRPVLGYKPIFVRNMLGLQRDTHFSHDELEFMISIGVDVHIIGRDLQNVLAALGTPAPQAPPVGNIQKYTTPKLVEELQRRLAAPGDGDELLGPLLRALAISAK